MNLTKLIEQSTALPWRIEETMDEDNFDIVNSDNFCVMRAYPEYAKLAVIAVNNLPALVDELRYLVNLGGGDCLDGARAILSKLDKEAGE